MSVVDFGPSVYPAREGTKARLLACIAQPRVRRGPGALDRTVD